MSGLDPEERVLVPALAQRWRWVAFLHWAVDPSVLEPLLPSGIVPDVVDGRAWIALTPMVIDQVSPLGLPLPRRARPSFPETNLRTYVRTPRGTEGIWFLALEAQHHPTVLGGRLAYGVPYHHATMSVERDGDAVRYRSHRVGRDGAVEHDITIEVGPPTDTDAAGGHLVGRWRAISHRGGITSVAPVRHERWPLHRATMTNLEENLLASVGIDRPSEPPLVHWAPAVHAALAAPRLEVLHRA